MKTAVFLRGHARTWKFTKKQLISFFSGIYGDIDWYISIWDTNTIDIDTLTLDFENCNVIKLELVNEHEVDKFDQQLQNFRGYWTVNDSNFLKLGYLDHRLSLVKRSHEIKHGFRYDSVAYIRTDCLYMLKNHSTIDLARDHALLEMEVDGCYLHRGLIKNDDWKVDDFYIRAGSVAADIYETRFLDPHYTDGRNFSFHWCPHALMSYIVPRNNLIVSHKTHIQGIMVRADYGDYLNSEIMFDPREADAHKFNKQWINLTNEQKRDYCLKENIDPRDYMVA